MQRDIVNIIAPAAPSFIAPSPSELNRLANIVLSTYPSLVYLDNLDGDTLGGKRREFAAQTEHAFAALSYVKRLSYPDRRHYCSFWMDECEILLRSLGIATDIRYGPFVTACLMHHDIVFEGLNQGASIPFSAGLDLLVGAEATDKWRGVLVGPVIDSAAIL